MTAATAGLGYCPNPECALLIDFIKNMFTGIVQVVGQIESVRRHDRDLTLDVATHGLERQSLNVGDSIAVNGACLTAVACDARSVRVDVSAETLSCTLLGDLSAGARVNLELALKAQDRLGGHLVSGHVDGVGTLVERRRDGRCWRMVFRAPGPLVRFIAGKGSICIDGVSLTVNGLVDEADAVRFDVNIVPHTMQATTFGEFAPGRAVHLEVDVVARYLERLVEAREGPKASGQAVSRELLERNGWVGSRR